MNKLITLERLNAKEVKELLPENLLFLSFRGSIAHGMYVPKNDPNSIDDKDIFGVYMEELQYYLGLDFYNNDKTLRENRERRKGTKERFIGEWDCVSHEIKKFLKLATRANPNILSILWMPERHVIYEHPLFKVVRQNKEIFLNKKQIYLAFRGYAKEQMDRMTTANFEGYMGAKRKSLVERFGYDCKNAAHLIRLLRMCIEALTLNTFLVHREDAVELLEIKNGKWTLEAVRQEAARLFRLAEEAYNKSTLPEEISEESEKKIEDIAINMILEYHKLKK